MESVYMIVLAKPDSKSVFFLIAKYAVISLVNNFKKT